MDRRFVQRLIVVIKVPRSLTHPGSSIEIDKLDVNDKVLNDLARLLISRLEQDDE